MRTPQRSTQGVQPAARGFKKKRAPPRIAPGAGSYVSESNYFNRHWQDAYWGRHYPRLRAVKDRYDPEGLFFGHNGVGSEDWSRDGFQRLR